MKTGKTGAVSLSSYDIVDIKDESFEIKKKSYSQDGNYKVSIRREELFDNNIPQNDIIVNNNSMQNSSEYAQDGNTRDGSPRWLISKPLHPHEEPYPVR